MGDSLLRMLLPCVLSLTVAGCSSASTGDWVGSWNAVLSQVSTCSGQRTTNPVYGVIAITAASTSTDAITLAPQGFGCTLTWTVDTSNAVLQFGQSCPAPELDTVYSNGGLRLDGNSISATAGSYTSLINPNGPPMECNFTEAGALTRGS
jgi:hypothetical protein